MSDYEDPRAKLDEIMERFKKSHAAVITHGIPAHEFIGADCVTHIDDMEGLMSVLCAQHDVSAMREGGA
jgi:hypothetical protein